jgi:RimJ/RimL family protein N-acetyltransferase
MEILRGGRVVVRPFRIEDIDDVAAACADPEIQGYLTHLPHPYTRDDARWWITEGSVAAFDRGDWAYGVADPATDRIIGGVGGGRRGRRGAEIGYWVAPWARQRGVATEAARLLAAHAFATGVQRLELRTHPENVASQRVAVGAGFTREATARGAGELRDGTPYDLIVWVRLNTDSGEPTARLLPDLPGGELTDGVVTLRPVTAADIDDTFAVRSLPECVLRSMPPVAPDRARVAQRCALSPSRWIAGERADLSIRDTATDRYAGEIGLYYIEPPTQQAMIGYNLGREWRGRGYATRAVALLIEWAFTHLDVERIIAGTAPDNTASHRVLARAGFEQEAYLRSRLPAADGGRVDDIQWVRLRPVR